MGFIGSHLARRLVNMGAHVTIIDNLLPHQGANEFNIHDIKQAISVNICDIRDQKSMANFIQKNDFFFNLASQTSHTRSMIDPITDLKINVTAQLQMLESCRKLRPDIKIVFTSTRQVYGKPVNLPVSENHPLDPMDINGVHKSTGEAYHLLYHKLFDIPVTILRLTNTYGPGMRIQDGQQCFIGIWMRALCEGNSFQVFGDGEQLRDFNYVDDCVEALLLAGTHASTNGKVYNLGSQEVISLRTLAETMIYLGYGGSFELVPFPQEREKIDIGNYYSDFTIINQDLQWSPKVNLTSGLTKTIRFYKQHYTKYLTHIAP